MGFVDLGFRLFAFIGFRTQRLRAQAGCPWFRA